MEYTVAERNAQLNNEKHLFYGKNVLHQVITLATNEISGVVEVTSKNIKFEIDGSSVHVNVSMSLKYGHNASDVAYRVQENIKRSVETMTDYRVDKIDVNIIGVVLDESD